MTQKEAINKMLKDSGKTKTYLSKEMGYSQPTGISNILKRGNVNLSTMCKICSILGYKIEIHEKGTRTNGIELTVSKEDC